MAAGDENAGMKKQKKWRGRDSISTESRAGTYHNRGQTTHGIKETFSSECCSADAARSPRILVCMMTV